MRDMLTKDTIFFWVLSCENINLWEFRDATRKEEIMAAAKIVRAHEFIHAAKKWL